MAGRSEASSESYEQHMATTLGQEFFPLPRGAVPACLFEAARVWPLSEQTVRAGGEFVRDLLCARRVPTPRGQLPSLPFPVQPGCLCAPVRTRFSALPAVVRPRPPA